MGCMIAMWVSINCPVEFTIAKNAIVLQDYLDMLLPKLLPLAFTMGIFAAIKKNIKVTKIIVGIVLIGFVLGLLGIISM